MRHVRTLGLCLLAVLALGAMVAGSASAALPEVGSCVEHAGGRYSDEACTVKAHPKTRGDYEWVPHPFGFGANVEFDNHRFDGPGHIGPTTIETTSGHQIYCADTTSVYNENPEVYVEIGSPNTVSPVLVSFTSCKEVGGESRECYSPGYQNNEEGEGGTITDTNQWYEEEGPRGQLEIIAGKGTQSPTVGLVLAAFEPGSEDNERKRLLTAECEGPMGTVWIGGETTKKHGSDTIIAQIGPIDQRTDTLSVDFSQTNGIQEPAAFKGHPRFLEALLKNEWEQVGLASTWEMTRTKTSSDEEIKAIP